MAGYIRYQEFMIDLFRERMEPFLQARANGEEPPEITEDQKFLNMCFLGLAEISNTIEAIELIENLISVAPPRSKRIRYDQYLKYHINSHFHEIYIFKERINSYATKIIRTYRNTTRHDFVNRKITPLFKLGKLLEGMNSARNSHVHEARYSDSEMNKLESFSLISTYGHGGEEFRELTKLEYKNQARKWKETVSKNNIMLNRILDVYFDRIYNAVTIDDDIVFPSSI